MEEKRVRRILDILRPDITLTIESGGDQPTTTTDCVEHAYRAEQCLNQLKEKRQRMCKNKKRQGELGGNRSNDN